MSVRVMADVWDGGPEDAVDCSVLLALANHCDDNGRSCFPSVATVARMARRSQKTVERSVQQLVDDGWLSVERGGGRGVFSSYVLNVEVLSERATAARRERNKGRQAVAFSGGAEAGKGRLCVLEKATPAPETATPAASYKEDPSCTHQGNPSTPQPPSRGDGGVELPALSREEFLADLAQVNALRGRMTPPKPPFSEEDWRKVVLESHRAEVRKAAVATEAAGWEPRRTKAGRLRWRRRGS